MTTDKVQVQDAVGHQRELVRLSARRMQDLLRELNAAQGRERVREQQADATKTARLRALRLGNEAAADLRAPRPGGSDAPPRAE